LSYAEAASALEIPVGTVMSRLHRGRERLAATIAA
jgi:RNA polymerase sigma-70 factor (ECF subfamily)